jgi:hypothetical protein
MPSNDLIPLSLTPAYLTACLTELVNGPYADADTAGAADLAAETVRYLNYAAPRGGITEPATVAAVAASLAATAWRLPQLMSALAEWLAAEATAGRLADDHRRPPADLTALIRAATSQAGDRAGDLAAALSTVHNLSATLHAAGPAGPAPAETPAATEKGIP